MASLYGISLKHIKEFEGRSGSLAKGDLYIGNIKIGAFTEVDGGAAPAVDMVEPYAYNRFIEALDRRKSDLKISTYEDFLYGLLCMTQDEEAYRKFLKNGISAMAVQSVAYLLHYIPLKKRIGELSDEEITCYLKPMLEENMRADGGQNYEVKIYRSLDEFVQGEPICIGELEGTKRN